MGLTGAELPSHTVELIQHAFKVGQRNGLLAANRLPINEKLVIEGWFRDHLAEVYPNEKLSGQELFTLRKTFYFAVARCMNWHTKLFCPSSEAYAQIKPVAEEVNFIMSLLRPANEKEP